MINNSQKRKDQARKSIEILNASYSKSEITRTAYLKSHKALVGKIKNANSVSNQMKDNGLKVTKKGSGYMYNGKNFSVEVFLDGCVTDFWTIYLVDASEELIEEYEDNNRFDTKSEVIWALFQFDMSL